MKYIVFDIETSNIFQDVGKRDPSLLDIALLALYNSETGNYSSFLHNELSSLWPVIEKADALVGFNSDHFDIPLLNKYYHGDLENIKSIDLMREIRGSFGRRVGLDAVAQATLGVEKSADGLQALRWWKNGEIEKVRKYCIHDVKITKMLFEHMLENGEVKLPDRKTGEIITVPVDTSGWREKEKSGMTGSLPF